MDGDGVEDAVAAHGRAGSGQLLVAGGRLPPGSAWVAPWPSGIDPKTALLRVEGCALSWVSAP